jgi:hypothetical protein
MQKDAQQAVPLGQEDVGKIIHHPYKRDPGPLCYPTTCTEGSEKNSKTRKEASKEKLFKNLKTYTIVK